MTRNLKQYYIYCLEDVYIINLVAFTYLTAWTKVYFVDFLTLIISDILASSSSLLSSDILASFSSLLSLDVPPAAIKIQSETTIKENENIEV